MCHSRKKFRVGSQELFYLCSCGDSHLTWRHTSKINEAKISPQALKSFRDGNGLKDFLVLSEEKKIDGKPLYNYEIILVSEFNPSRPLLEMNTVPIGSLEDVPDNSRAQKSLFRPKVSINSDSDDLDDGLGAALRHGW